MIDAKKAIEIALTYMKDVYPNAIDFELEEIEISDDRSHWSITISMPDNNKATVAILSGINRKYKKIIIDGLTGEVKGMQIRKL